MYFLTTADIINPETCEPIVRRMTTLSIEDVRTLQGRYGIDSIPCVICTDSYALQSVTNDMMDGKL
jgi:hypothetical protein